LRDIPQAHHHTRKKYQKMAISFQLEEWNKYLPSYKEKISVYVMKKWKCYLNRRMEKKYYPSTLNINNQYTWDNVWVPMKSALWKISF
jgi:hypothetical protein